MKLIQITGTRKSRAFSIALLALILIVAAVSLHSALLKKGPDPASGVTYTHYNNFLIFKSSFSHLIENKDLYAPYPQEYFDRYKYSPSFALLMAPFHLFPENVGLFLWNLLNAMVLFFAIWMFPSLNLKEKLLALIFLLPELVTSIQNDQSNALIAGLIIFAFIFLEKNRPWTASLMIVLSVFIKLFGLVALALFIFYPKKLKNSLITLSWIMIIALLPLLVFSMEGLAGQYTSWIGIINADLAVNEGYSVIGWLHSWFGLEAEKGIVVVAGALMLLAPLLRLKAWKDLQFRELFLSSVLIWMVIFNHMAESPTFIIAVSGVTIWFFSKHERSWLDIALLVLVFIFTNLSHTDVFPHSFRKSWFIPYAVKAFPCILVWLKVQYDMFFLRVDETPSESLKTS